MDQSSWAACTAIGPVFHCTDLFIILYFVQFYETVDDLVPGTGHFPADRNADLAFSFG